MFKKIKNKKVLITGASSGIGACMAELFSSYGAIVGIHYNQSENEAKRLLELIKSKRGKAACFKKNLLESPVNFQLIQSFVKKFGGIDVLINNAGAIIGNIHFLELDERSWDDTFSLNVKAPFFLAREAFNYMKNSGGGKIINISSIAAKYGGSIQSMHYGAAKAALDSLTIGLARAGAQYNILVNSIRGGFIDTPFHKKIHRTKKDIEERIKLTPLRRAGKPTDIAQMALFLASEAGDYITGEIFTISGGD